MTCCALSTLIFENTTTKTLGVTVGALEVGFVIPPTKLERALRTLSPGG